MTTAGGHGRAYWGVGLSLEGYGKIRHTITNGSLFLRMGGI